MPPGQQLSMAGTKRSRLFHFFLIENLYDARIFQPYTSCPPISLVSFFISRDYLQVLPPFTASSEMVVLAKKLGAQLPFGQNYQNMYAPRATTQHGGY